MSELPFNPKAPFTRKRALIAGLTDADLTGARYQQLFWGVYISSTVKVTLVVRALAALMVAPPGSIVSHHSAASLWCGIAPDSGDVHLSMPHGNRQKTRGIRSHRMTRMPTPRSRRGLPVTSPEQTFIDLAQFCDLVQLVVLGDSLVKAKATTPTKLMAACEGSAARHAALARRAASLVRTKVDSPMESRVRMLMVLAGLREPRVNFELCEDDGRVKYRLDLSYPDRLLAVEFDGRPHVEVQAQWEGDVIRREDVEADGWRFVVVTSTQFYGSPGAVLERIVAAMRERGVPVPRRLRGEWRRYFSGPDDLS
jgi:very-short-patch-repair endonuclease